MTSGLKRLLPIVSQQRARDVSEADTVTLVKDLLSEVLGYDKYADVTAEFAIRGTYCDLAVKQDDKLVLLIEVKAIGITLDDRHVKQAVDYAANQGIEWVILTNAITWRLYHVIFAKPIDKRLLIELDMLSLDVKKPACQELLYLFTKEGFNRGAHLDLRDRQDATSRFMLAALLLNNESVINTIRRELRRVVEVVVDESAVLSVLRDEVIKRDALEGPAADAAVRRVTRKEDRPLAPSGPRSKAARVSRWPWAKRWLGRITVSQAPPRCRPRYRRVDQRPGSPCISRETIRSWDRPKPVDPELKTAQTLAAFKLQSYAWPIVFPNRHCMEPPSEKMPLPDPPIRPMATDNRVVVSFSLYRCRIGAHRWPSVRRSAPVNQTPLRAIAASW